MARKIDAEEISLEVVDSTMALISGGKIKYNLNCIKADEYPDIDLEPTGTRMKLSRLDFSALVSQTAFAASTKEQRPILTAMHLEAFEGLLTATTTDSARMAKKSIPVEAELMFSANVPAKMMVEVDHLLEGSESVEAAFSDKKALFSFENTLVATRLVAGEYPNTKNIVPRITNYVLEVNASKLLVSDTLSRQIISAGTRPPRTSRISSILLYQWLPLGSIPLGPPMVLSNSAAFLAASSHVTPDWSL